MDSPSGRKALTPAERGFLDRLLALAAGSASPPPDGDALDEFRRVIIGGWDSLRWRLLGTTVERLRELSPTQHALLRQLQESPDLLTPLERDRDEVFHTRLIAWVLGREGPVGDLCRRALARQLGLGDHEPPSAETEVLVAPGCRVDLVLQTRRHLVYIEAKVDADERPDQLADYRKALRVNAGRRRGLLVFLTVDPPATSSAEHLPLQFKELVALWLPATLLPGPDARYLASYLVTVAGSLCEAREEGPFATWSLRTQHRLIDILQTIEESDAPSG